MYKIFLRTYYTLFILTLFSLKITGQDIGYFIIESNVAEFLIVVDNDFENYLEISSGDTLSLLSGKRSFRMIAPTINDNFFEKTIYSGLITGISIQVKDFNKYPRSSYSLLTSKNPVNIKIFTDLDSEIIINGTPMGYGSYSGFLTPDLYNLTINNTQLGSSKLTFETNLMENEIIKRFNQDYSTTPKILKFLPSVGYFSNKQYKKGAFTLFTISSLLFSSKLLQSSAEELEHDLKLARQNPFNPIYQQDESFKARIEKILDKQDKHRRNSRITLLSAGLIYCVTTFDSFRKPKGGYKTIPRQLSISYDMVDSKIVPTLNTKLSF